METPNNATQTDDRTIVLTRLFDAPPQRVFNAWTDPGQVGQWWGPEGFTTTTYTMEVKPGGVWRFVMHGPDGRDYQNRIEYLEVEPPTRLVYKQGGEEGTTEEDIHFHVTVTFADEGGKTRLTSRMVFDTPEECRHVVEEYGAIEGGEQHLKRLALYLTAQA